jgi:hypothetical protein
LQRRQWSSILYPFVAFHRLRCNCCFSCFHCCFGLFPCSRSFLHCHFSRLKRFILLQASSIAYCATHCDVVHPLCLPSTRSSLRSLKRDQGSLAVANSATRCVSSEVAIVSSASTAATAASSASMSGFIIWAALAAGEVRTAPRPSHQGSHRHCILDDVINTSQRNWPKFWRKYVRCFFVGPKWAASDHLICTTVRTRTDTALLQRRGESRATINEVFCGLRRLCIYVL